MTWDEGRNCSARSAPPGTVLAGSLTLVGLMEVDFWVVVEVGFEVQLVGAYQVQASQQHVSPLEYDAH